MSVTARRLRREVERLGRGTNRRYAPELRERILSYVEDRRREGAAWEVLAVETGVSHETLRVWSAVRPHSRAAGARASKVRSTALVPVTVVAEPTVGRAVTIVSPAGFRLEGLDAASAVAALKALG